ncbi:MAG TPA: type II toxin-antitoxin system RelE/ParE family toxin [Flavobacteriales bacterium]|nr:type II toxin-antitoxin system RelE/ParE family toxin [Flavobacteriales bacterium]
MAEVIWSPSAKRDLHAIHDHIAQDSVFYARRFVERIVDHAATLATHPLKGHVVREFKDLSIREVMLDDYRIIHRITSGEVQIIRIFHAKRVLRPKHLRS